MGNERFNAIAFQTANALATVLLATTVMSVYYRAQLRKSMGHYIIKCHSLLIHLLLTNKLSLMEDLKAILTVGAILVVPFIAAPKAMFAIVLYIIIYMAFRWEKFLIINLIIYRLWKHYRLCQSWHREGTAI